jgi:hypothetical protein
MQMRPLVVALVYQHLKPILLLQEGVRRRFGSTLLKR